MLEHKDLRQVGLKVTLPRIKILQILEGADPHHMSAEELYKKLLDAGEDVGLATVYRVLTQFETAGLVRRHNFEGGRSVYEIDDGQHHDHLVCLHCNLVQEFMDSTIERRQQQIAEKVKFKMTDHSLTIYGLCSACQ
ncbi:MAG: transcriptional repressor [Coxiella sp. RIFCSPHIGHO2_12_FULL_42_15]|nr:MAG: transcriptional repressor [Coxiella sp. RIFCSPHIGHO2_12_FULL_42_15]